MKPRKKRLVAPDALGEPDRIMWRGAPWLSVEGVQAVLGVHFTRVYMLVRRGTLRGERRDNKTYVRQADVERFQRHRDWWNELHSPKPAA